MHRAFHIAGWGFVAVCTAVAFKAARPAAVTATTTATTAAAPDPFAGAESAPAEWFRRIKPYCNAVEIEVVQRQAPAPDGVEGQGYRAACYALAGRIDAARHVIDALPADQRASAANVVFNVGHPVADAGDDRSAGPIMELVVDYWPNHYMALYHAGMAEYMLGQHALAQQNLEAFLRNYDVNDGWRSNALEVLARLRDPDGRGSEDRRRPREPGS
jgi:tetratricopeptide (TPR) repeat protein